MSGYTNEKVQTGAYEATIVPEYAHTMTDVAEPLIQYGFTKKRIDDITKGLNDLQYVLPGSAAPLVFSSRTDTYKDSLDVEYVWTGSGRSAVKIKIKQYQTPTDPFQLTIYPANPDFQEKVKGVLGKYGERQGLQEVALRQGLPKDMTRETLAKFIGGKKTRKASRKARKTRRH